MLLITLWPLPCPAEEAARLHASQPGADVKLAFNCSFPGAERITASPITGPKLISDANREKWYGGKFGRC